MDINKVIMIGRLGQDPTLKFTANQFPILHMAIAVNDSVKNEEGKYVKIPDWHKVTVLGDHAKNISNYLKKGMLVYVEGRLKNNKWEDKNGSKRTDTYILASTLLIIGSNKDKEDKEDIVPSETVKGNKVKQKLTPPEDVFGVSELPF